MKNTHTHSSNTGCLVFHTFWWTMKGKKEKKRKKKKIEF